MELDSYKLSMLIFWQFLRGILSTLLTARGQYIQCNTREVVGVALFVLKSAVCAPGILSCFISLEGAKNEDFTQ